MRPITPDRVRMLVGVGAPFSANSAVKTITACNILLALYNFMCFSVPRDRSGPCVVVPKDSQLQKAAEDGSIAMVHLASDEVKPKAGSALPQEFRGEHVVLPNYVRAKGRRPAFDNSVTYTTQATHRFFFPHVSELCTRWGGPVSLAVYAPGTDLAVVNRMLAHLVHCVPCVASNVSFHIVYHSRHRPPSIPEDPERHIGSLEYDCQNPPNDTSNYRKLAGLHYPINVLRNVARLRAETRYILASDIELYPSSNIIPRFIKLAESARPRRAVYTLPLFEVEKGQQVPRTKTELQQLFAAQKAVFFHKYVCDICQNFSGRDRWIHQDETDSPALNVFSSSKRHKDRSSWEPIYIGTNDEPLYAEELSWEGKRDKMSQMTELCLMDYTFLILNDAFLCHAPGIKRVDRQDIAWRTPYVQKNNAFYTSILAGLKVKHSKVRTEKCF